MKYILIDEKDGDMFDKEFATKEEAIQAADIEWSYLTSQEKLKRSSFYVLESANENEDSENHFDGNVIKDYKNTYQEDIK